MIWAWIVTIGRRLMGHRSRYEPKEDSRLGKEMEFLKRVAVYNTFQLEAIMSNQEQLDARAVVLENQFAEVLQKLDELQAAVDEAHNTPPEEPLDFTRIDAALAAVVDAVPTPAP